MMEKNESATSERRQESFPRLHYPAARDTGLRLPLQWLRGKRAHDGAEDLWRVGDRLYDLATFAAQHPGGADWILFTKGTDITEAFETHHLGGGGTAARLLQRFYVRAACGPRNSPFTFHEDGFYHQLREEVRAELTALPPDARAAALRSSDRVTDAAAAAVVALGPLAAWLAARAPLAAAAAAALAAGLALSALTVCAHNYFHRRDNWRMYLFNICGFNYREWRVSHALSHHLHTNTAQDVELSMLEPFLVYLPRRHKPLAAQLAALYFPLVFPFVSIFSMLKGWTAAALDLDGQRAECRATDLLPLALPAAMWCAGGAAGLLAWLLLTLVCSFTFMLVGLTAGHHANTNFMEGDVPRAQSVDWGEHQLATVVEREEYAGRATPALALTRFGDHALHHLFPTLDHALLPRLYPALRRLCDRHGLALRTTSLPAAIVAQSRQLARRNPHRFDLKPPRLARI